MWRSNHGVQGERCFRNFYRLSNRIRLAFMDTYRAFAKGFEITRQSRSITLFEGVFHQPSAGQRLGNPVVRPSSNNASAADRP